MKKWLFIVCLGIAAYARAEEDKQLPITNFSGGLNSYFSPLTIDDTQVKDANNVLFDEDNAVTKRKGFTLCGSSKSYSFDSGWSYTDSTNSTWIIVRASDSIIAANTPCTFTVQIATVSVNSIVNAVNAFGSIYFVDQIQGVYSWNGTTTTYVAGSPLGSLIAEFRGRLWVAGLAIPNGNKLYASGYLSGTNWTTGSIATDPFVLMVGLQDNFDNISALFSGYNDMLSVFKSHSSYGIFGFDQSDFAIRVLNREIGCLDQRSIQPFLGGLIFLSQRGIEFFDGLNATLISRQVKDKVDPSIRTAGFSNQSWAQSTQADWQAGTLNQLSATISPPSLVLSTQAAFSGVDTNDSDFGAATTIVDVDTYTISGSVRLASDYGSEFIDQSNYPPISVTAGATHLGCYDAGQQFTTSSYPQRITAVGLGLGCSTSCSNNTLDIQTDNADTPSGIALVSTTLGALGITPGTGLSSVTIHLTPTVLAPNTKYWIFIHAGGGGSCPFTGTGWGFGTAYSGGIPYSVESPTVTNDFAFITYTETLTNYRSSGSIISRVFDVGVDTNTYLWNWGNFTANYTLNTGSITFSTQVSSASTGPWDSPVSVNSGSPIGSATKRYIRYLSTVTTPSASVSPVLTDVTVETSAMRRSSGTFKSQIHQTGSVSSYGSFSAAETLNGGNIAFSICSSTNSNMGAPASCAAQAINSQITVATGTYVQWFATTTITNATQNPSLQSGTVQWFSGNRPILMSSVVHDNRYWLALSTTTNSTQNDAVLVLTKGPVWSVFDIHAGSLFEYKNNLYHTNNQDNGKVYADWQGYNDDGAAINAYVRSKDYLPEGWMVDKTIKSLHLMAEPLGAYTLSSAYELDRSGTLYPFDDITVNELTGRTSLNLYAPKAASYAPFGKSISIRFGNNVVDEPMKVYGGNVVYSPRPIIQ